jgi:hypothetical protein
MKVKFKVKGKDTIKIGTLTNDGLFVDVGDNIYYSTSVVQILEMLRKDKSEFKKLILSRKKKLIDERFICRGCGKDIRVHNSRASVMTEVNDYIIWRFICGCGEIKNVLINVNNNENEE